MIKIRSNIKDSIGDGKKVPSGFTYDSNNNSEWLQPKELEKWIEVNIKNLIEI